MSFTNVNNCFDSEVKKDFEQFCKEAELSGLSVFNLCDKEVVGDNKIPFEIEGDHPNDHTNNAFLEAEDIIRHPENHKSYTSTEEMFDDILNS